MWDYCFLFMNQDAQQQSLLIKPLWLAITYQLMAGFIRVICFLEGGVFILTFHVAAQVQPSDEANSNIRVDPSWPNIPSVLIASDVHPLLPSLNKQPLSLRNTDSHTKNSTMHIQKCQTVSQSTGLAFVEPSYIFILEPPNKGLVAFWQQRILSLMDIKRVLKEILLNPFLVCPLCVYTFLKANIPSCMCVDLIFPTRPPNYPGHCREAPPCWPRGCFLSVASRSLKSFSELSPGVRRLQPFIVTGLSAC